MVSKQQTPLTVTLPAPEADIVRLAVAEGGYASDTQMIQAAIRQWQEIHIDGEAALKAAYDEGMASGEGRTVDRKDFLARLKARHTARG